MDKVDEYRLRRIARLIERGIRLDADEEDAGWRTTENGKKYQLDPDTGDVIKGKIGVENVNDTPIKSAKVAKEQSKIKRQIKEIDKKIHENNMSDGGTSRANREYHEKDDELRKQRAELMSKLHGKRENRPENAGKKYKSILKSFTEKGLSEEEEKKLRERGMSEDYIADMKDRSWFKLTGKDRDEIEEAVKRGESERDISNSIRDKFEKQCNERSYERRKQAEKAKREEIVKATNTWKDDYVKCVESGDEDGANSAIEKMTRKVFEPNIIANAVMGYIIQNKREPTGWNAVKDEVIRSITSRVRSFDNNAETEDRVAKAVDAYMNKRENALWFMNEYKKEFPNGVGISYRAATSRIRPPRYRGGTELGRRSYYRA